MPSHPHVIVFAERGRSSPAEKALGADVITVISGLRVSGLRRRGYAPASVLGARARRTPRVAPLVRALRGRASRASSATATSRRHGRVLAAVAAITAVTAVTVTAHRHRHGERGRVAVAGTADDARRIRRGTLGAASGAVRRTRDATAPARARQLGAGSPTREGRDQTDVGTLRVEVGRRSRLLPRSSGAGSAAGDPRRGRALRRSSPRRVPRLVLEPDAEDDLDARVDRGVLSASAATAEDGRRHVH